MTEPRQIQGSIAFRIDNWECLPQTIGFLMDVRDNLRLMGKFNPDIDAGLNYTIILNSCCAFEGIMEGGLSALYEKVDAKSTDTGLNKAVHLGAGLDHYKDLFQRITGLNIATLPTVSRHYEGLCTLFKLRNLLAHGRNQVVSVTIAAKAGDPTPIAADRRGGKVVGNYNAVDPYLIKHGLLDATLEVKVPDTTYLNAKVADHFAEVVFKTVDAIISDLPPTLRATFENGTRPRSVFETFAKLLSNRTPNSRRRTAPAVSNFISQVNGICIPCRPS